MRTYHLFRTPNGFSNLTENYCGETYTVAANSLRQALAVAYKDVWVNTPGEDVGIISIETKERGRLLWCYCEGHHIHFSIGHLKGVRAMRAAAERHYLEAGEDCESSESYNSLVGLTPEEISEIT